MPGPRNHVGDGAASASQTIAEVVTAVFARFDTDANASITLTELTSVLDPDGDRSDLPATLKTKVAAIDSNADGSLSKAEVTTAVTAADTNRDGSISRADASPGATAFQAIDFLFHGPGGGHGPGGPRPEPTPVTISAATDGIFKLLDTDASNTITLSEVLKLLDPTGTNTRHAALATDLVTQVDSNHDGAMSRAEVTAALTALETNGDGSLSPADHVAGQAHDDAVALVGVLLHHLDLPG